MPTGLASNSVFIFCAAVGVGAPALLGEGVLGGVAFLFGPSPPTSPKICLLIGPAALGGTDGAGIGLAVGDGITLEGDLA